ncbi:MAG TPA: dTDP-4-dehydrorhamnose reductase [Rhabdochlamydiaceae bacterium]|jgi:dTDP-4-dehydrorhamnose reductase
MSSRVKLWILGAEGMLGRALLKVCVARGIDAVGSAKREADITLKENLAQKARALLPSHIVNCAAYTDVDGAEREYEKAHCVNAQGAQNAAQAAQDVGARFVHISTDYVFSGTSSTPYSEEMEALPVNAYGASKWEGERGVFLAHPDACIVRTSWLFDEGGKNFVSWLLNALKIKEEIRAVADQWGCPTYAPDLASGILDLLEHKGVFHFANPEGASRFEIAQFAFAHMQKCAIPLACQRVLSVGKEAFSAPAPRPSFSVLNTAKFTSATGKRPRLWQEALGEFLTKVHYAKL